MAEKAPGKPRKTATSRKKETEQKTTQKASTVTPIDRSGAHPAADQSGAGAPPNPVAKQGGSNPSVLNPRGSVQEGSHAAGVRATRPDLDERIRHRAYELFEQRGRREGFHDEDWAQAEAEILAEFEREKSA
jgi:hypothetical protein